MLRWLSVLLTASQGSCRLVGAALTHNRAPVSRSSCNSSTLHAQPATRRRLWASRSVGTEPDSLRSALSHQTGPGTNAALTAACSFSRLGPSTRSVTELAGWLLESSGDGDLALQRLLPPEQVRWKLASDNRAARVHAGANFADLLPDCLLRPLRSRSRCEPGPGVHCGWISTLCVPSTKSSLLPATSPNRAFRQLLLFVFGARGLFVFRARRSLFLNTRRLAPAGSTQRARPPWSFPFEDWLASTGSGFVSFPGGRQLHLAVSYW